MVSLISPCLLAFYHHKGKTRREKQKDDLLPVGCSMSQDSRGEICFEEWCFYFEAGESQGETVQRYDCTGWEGSSPSSIPKGKLNIRYFLWIQKTIISHKVCSDLPPCNRYLAPTCIFTLSSMARRHRFVQCAVRHRLCSWPQTQSLPEPKKTVQSQCLTFGVGMPISCRPVPKPAPHPLLQTT